MRRPAVDTIRKTEKIDHHRRRLLGTAAIGVAVAGATSLFPSQLAAEPAGDANRPFRVDVPDEQLVDLRRRIAATRWPDRETVNDQFIPAGTIHAAKNVGSDIAKELATYVVKKGKPLLTLVK
jgi:hypothetical protein